MVSAFVLCKSHILKYIFDSPDDSALLAADLRSLIIRRMSVMFAIYLSEPNQGLTFKEPCGWYKAFDGQNPRFGALMTSRSGDCAFFLSI